MGLLLMGGFVNHSVWVGNEQVLDARRAGRLARVGARETYARLPTPRLAEEDYVYVLAESLDWPPRLGHVSVADSKSIESWIARRALLQLEFPRTAAVAMLFLATLCAAPAWQRGRARESTLFWGAVTLISWSASIFWATAETRWLPPQYYDPIGYVTRAALVIGLLMLSVRMRGLPRLRLEAVLAVAMAAWALLAYPFALLSWSWYSWIGTRIFEAVLLCAGLFVVHNLYQAARIERSASLSLLFGSVLIALMLGARDTLAFWGWMANPSLGYFAFSAPFVALAIGSVLLHRFSTATLDAAALSYVLEDRVQQASIRLENEMRQRLAAERRRARAEQHERLVRDMHDGSGGHLVQALAITESGGDPQLVVAALDNALEDLEMMAESSTLHFDSLADALVNLVSRLKPRIAATGVRLCWLGDTKAERRQRTMAEIMNAVRVVQEAISNVVKHAGATSIDVSMTRLPDGKALRVTIADNGTGFEVSNSRTGRGLNNMLRRAAMLAGHIELASNSDGTRLTLTLPDS